uniref:Large ribosomal subunit protein eL28 n=1 Tax=Angiostrongylus cantonensis TaxID=6313 RepID=A0A0K0D1Q1_ANGCA
MSADLTWQIIRNNSCFLRRQKGIKKHFSVEPFNLRGINSRRYNGLISKRAMDLKPFKEGPGVTVKLKIPSMTRVSYTKHLRRLLPKANWSIFLSTGLSAWICRKTVCLFSEDGLFFAVEVQLGNISSSMIFPIMK